MANAMPVNLPHLGGAAGLPDLAWAQFVEPDWSPMVMKSLYSRELP